ncbi:MAG: HAMP domain-containing sensor histidine kinase [Candidatus Promineifilaceae bacterium]|nr:HAMP domain-containing sensor histidine kinase [Candidatus Promineifilaceae bacterium]
MFGTLRSRLLLSYLTIIAAVLLLVALALLVISAAPATARLRILPTLQQLRTVAISTEREMAVLSQQGVDRDTLRERLEQTAAAHDVRILLVRPAGGRILFDTQREGSWEGLTLGEGNVRRLPGLFPELSPARPVGRFRAPDGSSWLIFTDRVGDQRLWAVFATPEMGALAFFRDNFLPPLWRAGAVALLLSLLLAFVISRSVAQPLQQMAGAAEAVAEGDYDQRLSLRGPEEVQRVAESFNHMARRVQATQQAQRDFLLNVSHDLKTPLTSIQGWSQALQDGTATEPEQLATAAEIIHEEGERMTRMVSELLQLVRIDSGEMQLRPAWVDLAQLLEDVLRNLSWQAEQKGVEVALDTRQVPPVWGDPDRLTQIFTNLIDNGFAHTPAGGRLAVRLLAPDAETAAVMVEDNGPGISPEEVDRIFERFYQVEKSRARAYEEGGVGLGLAIAKELVEAHGGEIEVRSEVGKGSVFIVRLPVRPGE